MANKLRKKKKSATLTLLAKLGNRHPKPQQIELLETLVFTIPLQQHLIFHKKLTARELSCLLLAAKGKTIEECAKLLIVKSSTIKTWRTNILRKLKCGSMAQAIFIGIHYGYVTAPLLSNEASHQNQEFSI